MYESVTSDTQRVSVDNVSSKYNRTHSPPNEKLCVFPKKNVASQLRRRREEEREGERERNSHSLDFIKVKIPRCSENRSREAEEEYNK